MSKDPFGHLKEDIVGFEKLGACSKGSVCLGRTSDSSSERVVKNESHGHFPHLRSMAQGSLLLDLGYKESMDFCVNNFMVLLAISNGGVIQKP